MGKSSKKLVGFPAKHGTNRRDVGMMGRRWMGWSKMMRDLVEIDVVMQLGRSFFEHETS